MIFPSSHIPATTCSIITPFNLQNQEPNKHLFFIKLACLGYAITVMKNWVIQYVVYEFVTPSVKNSRIYISNMDMSIISSDLSMLHILVTRCLLGEVYTHSGFHNFCCILFPYWLSIEFIIFPSLEPVLGYFKMIMVLFSTTIVTSMIECLPVRMIKIHYFIHCSCSSLNITSPSDFSWLLPFRSIVVHILSKFSVISRGFVYLLWYQKTFHFHKVFF
jgi:hypothetical protein